MKRKVNFASFKEAISAPAAGFGGESSLSHESGKHKSLEMYTGVEPGFLTVSAKGASVGVPLANVKALVWESPNDKE